MMIGEPSYVEQLCKMAVGSNGAVNIEYLMQADGDHVLLINNTFKKVAEEIKRG